MAYGFEVAKVSPLDPYFPGKDRPDTYIVISQTGNVPTSAASRTEMLESSLTAFLRINVKGGDEYSIPVKYSFYIKKFFVLRNLDGDETEENDIMNSISFGEQNMDMGSKMTIYVKNPNNFAVNLSSTMDNSQFSLDEFNPILEGQECKEIQVALSPYNPVDESAEVPKSVTFSGLLTLHTDQDELGVSSIELLGTLVDVRFYFLNTL